MAKQREAGVYLIRSRSGGEQYVGSSSNIARRWRRHRYELNAGCHHGTYLQRLWSKRGADDFEFAVLEQCDPGLVGLKQALMSAEQRWLDLIQPALNTLKVAYSNLGFRHSPETRDKIGAANIGKKYSAERVARSIAARAPWVLTEAERENLRVKLTGRKHSPEAIEKIRAASVGRKPTAETLAKLRGRKPSPESIAKGAALRRGKKRSLESIEKQRQALLGRKLTQEHKDKIRQQTLAWRQRQRDERAAAQ